MSDQELNFDDGVFVFETVMRVRNIEISGGGYLTMESLTALLAESRARFLYSKGIDDISADHQGLVVDSLQLNMIGQVRPREELLFEVGIEKITNDDGEIVIKVTRMHNGSLVAKARQHFVHYDYRLNQVSPIPTLIQEALNPQPFEI